MRAVVLTGTGKVFCAGQDLGEHAAALDASPAQRLRYAGRALQPGHPDADRDAQAGDRGGQRHLRGRGHLAGARLRHPGLLIGGQVRDRVHRHRPDLRLRPFRHPDPGRRTARASELILLAEPFTAQQALDWGLVGRLAEPGEVRDESMALAARLAAGPTLAYAEAKRAIHAAALPALPDVLEAEHAAQAGSGRPPITRTRSAPSSPSSARYSTPADAGQPGAGQAGSTAARMRP